MKARKASLAAVGILLMLVVGCNGASGREFMPLSPIEIEAGRGVVFAVAAHRLSNTPGLPSAVTTPFNPAMKSREREVRSKGSADPASGLTNLFQAAVRSFPDPPKPKETPPPVQATQPPLTPKDRFLGYCPECGGRAVSRTRELDAKDTCENGHTYPAKFCKDTPPVDGRTVVTAYLPKWFFCPPCVPVQNDVDQMTKEQKAGLEFQLKLVEVRTEADIPAEFNRQDILFPLFVWTVGKDRFTHSGGGETWLKRLQAEYVASSLRVKSPSPVQSVAPVIKAGCVNPNCTCVNCQCNPCRCGVQQGGACGPNGCSPPMRAGRKGRRVSMAPQQSHGNPTDIAQVMAAATAQGLPAEYVRMILDAVGKEIPLTPQASIVMPATLGMKFVKVGDTLSLELSEPWPMLRYKTWGIRFDDFLKGMTLSPTLAVVKLKSYGDIKFAVE